MPEWLNPIDISSSVDAILQRAGTPGVSVAVVIDGNETLASGIGSRDLAGEEPLPTDARFYIYSITKTLLATLTLHLVEQGIVTLDCPIRAHLPDFPLTTPVTIRQVLSHTAGLPDYGGRPDYATAVRTHPEHAWTPAEFLERTLPGGLLFEPGDGWMYSNIGYLAIKNLLEHVTGLSLRDLVQQRIIEPLGLDSTFVAETLGDAATLTGGFSGWIDPNAPVADVSRRYDPGWVSHGVVISTAPELARIVDAIFDGRLLSTRWLAQMLTPVRVPFDHPLFTEPSYGLGVMLDPGSAYGLVAGHGGGGPGYSAGALHVENVGGHRVTIVALANSDAGDVGLPVAFDLLRMLGDGIRGT